MNILNSNLILLDIDLSSKEEALTYISTKMQEHGVLTNSQEYLLALLTRENHSSTALGNSFAVPHGILSSVKHPSVCILRLKKEILWEDTSDDPLADEPVKCIFCLAIPSTQNEGTNNIHVEILSKLCTLLLDPDTCNTILETKDSSSLLNLLEQNV